MSVSMPPSAMSHSQDSGRPPRHTSAESRSGSPYLAQQDVVNATQPTESSATYRPVSLQRSTSADTRNTGFPRGRPEESPGHRTRPRVPSEAGSESTMGARFRGSSQGGSLGAPGRQGSFQNVHGKLGGSVGIPGAPGMPLQPINRNRNSIDATQSSPLLARQRSMTDQAGMMPGNIGGSVGVPGGAQVRGESGNFREMGNYGNSSGSDRNSMSIGGSIGTPGKLGGSVGVPGPGMGRVRSQTDSNIMASGLSGTARGRSQSPQVQDLVPPDRASQLRPRSVSMDNRGEAQEYIPRTPSDVQAALQLGRHDYAPLDRTTPSGGINSSFPQPMPIMQPVSERDTPLVKIVTMAVAWAYCVFAWVCGVTRDFSQLDVMPHTPLHWQMTRSALHTLQDLWLRQAWFAFYALGFFSIVIPVAKISGTGYLIYSLTSKKASNIFKEHHVKIHAFSYFASYQFVDLYCGMLFVCFFTSEASSTRFGIGFYWFFSYCVASLMLSVFLDGILLESDSPDGEGDPAVPLIDSDDRPLSARGEGERTRNFDDRTRVNKGEIDDEEARVFSPKESNTRHNAWTPTPPWANLSPKSPYKTGAHKETFPDLWTTRFFSICFLIMFMLSPWGYFLEVRMIVHTIAVERTVMSLGQVLCELLPGKIHGAVIFTLWMLTVFFPLLYAGLQLARVEHKSRYKDTDDIKIGSSITINGQTFKTWSKIVVDLLRQWCHVDVVGIAALVFLFMVQDSTTLTMVPDGTFTFYFFIAAAASFMFLRWGSECEVSDGQNIQWGPKGRLIVLVLMYAGFITVIWGGVPGAAPHFQYQTLESVCQHAKPFLHKVSAQLPQSYGNCKDTDSHPPQPCVGDSNLQTSGDKKQYMNAIWIGGLRTMDVHECQMKKVENPRPGMSQYQFHIAGEFEKLSLYLRVKQCMPMGGCVNMNSADHCCGKHIGFNFTFSIDCKSVPGSMNAIRNLQLVDASFGKMIVHQDMLDDTVHIEAMDISGQVTGTVKDHIKDMLKMQVPWGGHQRSIGHMLNKLVQYNAPTDAGRCL